MLVSPSDVIDEREIIRKVIHYWNDVHSRDRGIVLIPVGWDTNSSPELGARAQELINTRILVHSDILVGVFWNRLGTPTGTAISGSVEEIQKHLATGKPAMIYFSEKPIAPGQIDPLQRQSVETFKSECQQLGLVESFSNSTEFGEKFTKQLQLCLSGNPYLQDIFKKSDLEPIEISTPTTLSGDAAYLLKAASESDDGWVRVSPHLSGTHIYCGDLTIFEGHGRELARWNAAIRELEEAEFIEPQGKHSYSLTDKGWRHAESLT